MKKKVLIIGAGPAGCAAVHKLSETKEFEITIIDKVPIFIPPATDNELPPTNIKAKVDMVVLL